MESKYSNQKKIDKEFGLTTFAVKNRTSVVVLTFIIVVLGVGAYISMPKEAFPEVKIPTIYVGTIHPGNSPEDMESLITRPLEKEINTIAEVDNIKSTSVQDYSTVIVEFTTDTDVEDALLKVKDAVDKAKQELPDDLQADPDVFELDFSEFPILNINLSGDFSLEELNKFGEYLEDEIEGFPEISKVDIRGVDEKEVKIIADPYKLEARKLSFQDIESAVAAENLNLSGGNILANGVRRNIRVLGEYKDPSELLNIVISNENDRIVYLKDVARVEFDYKDKESYARLNGNPVVMLDVVKRSGENLLLVTDNIFAVLAKAQAEVFPPGVKISITNDLSDQTREQVNSLENSIIFGVILVVLVLLFFLGTRNALFVGIAIPLSMFMAFMILQAVGVTINMMVLFSLIMALGMLVDNGIVVVENVYRMFEEGYSPKDATIKGVGEVAWPVIASTATTLAAFLPLAFWPGIMGEFMKYLPITLIITLGSSLFVALIINPVLISVLMRLDDPTKINYKKGLRTSAIALVLGILFLLVNITWLGNLLIFFALLLPLNLFVLTPLSRRFQKTFLPRLENLYVKIITYALAGRRPFAFLGGTFFLFIFSFFLMGVFQPNVIFFPVNQPLYVNVFIEFPVGTDITTTNEFTSMIEKKVTKIVEPYDYMVESIISNVGNGASDPNDMGSIGAGQTPNKGRITVNFLEYKLRKGVQTSDIMSEIRKGISNYPGVTITVDKDAAGPPTGKPVNIEVSGRDYPTLIAISENLKAFINESKIAGIEKLKTNLESGKPELIVEIDREKARRFGLSTGSIASEIRTALFGKEISKFKQGEDDYEVQLRLEDKYRYDVDVLMNKSVTYRNQNNGKIYQVPISSVASTEFTSSLGSIHRIDLDRVITISSNVLDGYNPTDINNHIKDLIQDFEVPAGYTIAFTGEQEKQAEEFAFLSKALMLAVFMIFLIIVSQFNKVSIPFIIMSSVLFSTIGVLLGLIIFQMDFIVIMTMIGIISLAGIVVNNAIVLMDFIELTRKRKREELGTDQRLPPEEIRNAIIQAGRTRLRPVLLTAITTILGLIPLAVGLNIDFIHFAQNYDPDFYLGGDNVIFWGPMSWTIIFGLTFATFLTLVIVPVMYLLTDKLNTKLGISKY
ncbi:MAG TPA: efflux RND transporter permease subunit [Cyclobacteriaceae bacterium]